MGEKVRVSSLLKMIDDATLENIAFETNVNYKSKKLSGEVVFKLLLMSLLDNTNISLRMMEKIFSGLSFKLYSGVSDGQTIRYSSLSERLSVIDHRYFERLFDHVHQLSQRYFDKGPIPYNIRQFDSTSLSLSSKLLKKGMVSGLRGSTGKPRKNQVKFTVGLLNNLPASIQLYNEQQHLAEDITLRKAVLEANLGDNDIVVFDRGLKKRTSFKEFDAKGILFVTRINPTKSIKVVARHAQVGDGQTATLDLLGDDEVYLYHQKKNLLKVPFRLIRARSKQTGEPLFFLTNIKGLQAGEITEIYKRRWDIEVFFKFIKQHLHFKHFINYSENGIKVMMYMSMIAGMLILLYKKLNLIKSYKIAKYEFAEQLNMEIIKEIVVICDGDPSKHKAFDTS